MAAWAYCEPALIYLADQIGGKPHLHTLGVQDLPIINPTRTEFRVFSVGSMSRVKNGNYYDFTYMCTRFFIASDSEALS